ncbi:MAG: Gfo/Idh/MocA family oxidoreductase [Actinomycetota bacterium]
MRIGVVGCGYWGSKHVRVFSELPAVSGVTIIDGRAPVRAAVGADFPRALQRASLAEALDDIDAVVIATPPESHFEVAAEAMTAGKHVLVEKPMATSTADARRMVRLSEEHGVVLAAGHTFAYNAAVWKLVELVRSGALGELHHLDAARLNLGLYREDVNVLWDLAAHDISITTMIMGQIPDTVSAWGDSYTDGFSEDIASLRMRFSGQGVESTVRASWLDPEKVRRTSAVGSERMAVYDDVDARSRIKIIDRSRTIKRGRGPGAPVSIDYVEGGIVTPAIDFREPLKVQAADFIACCMTGEQPIADGRAGLAVVAVLEASDRSLQEHGAPIPVDLPDLRLRSNRLQPSLSAA